MTSAQHFHSHTLDGCEDIADDRSHWWTSITSAQSFSQTRCWQLCMYCRSDSLVKSMTFAQSFSRMRCWQLYMYCWSDSLVEIYDFCFYFSLTHSWQEGEGVQCNSLKQNTVWTHHPPIQRPMRLVKTLLQEQNIWLLVYLYIMSYWKNESTLIHHSKIRHHSQIDPECGKSNSGRMATILSINSLFGLHGRKTKL